MHTWKREVRTRTWEREVRTRTWEREVRTRTWEREEAGDVQASLEVLVVELDVALGGESVEAGEERERLLNGDHVPVEER